MRAKATEIEKQGGLGKNVEVMKRIFTHGVSCVFLFLFWLYNDL